MYCPKCEKFVPSTATACPHCGIPIISGFSPNYGAGFSLGDDDTESRNDAPPAKVVNSPTSTTTCPTRMHRPQRASAAS